ncbi:MAG: hypothetical protein V4596_12620 [Bdellovibrionota bacterium]
MKLVLSTICLLATLLASNAFAEVDICHFRSGATHQKFEFRVEGASIEDSPVLKFAIEDITGPARLLLRREASYDKASGLLLVEKERSISVWQYIDINGKYGPNSKESLKRFDIRLPLSAGDAANSAKVLINGPKSAQIDCWTKK